jgi:hypothetical protein
MRGDVRGVKLSPDLEAPPSKESVVLLAIDPSVYNLGWACYCAAGGPLEGIMDGGWRFGCIHPRGETRIEKWSDALHKLARATWEWELTHFVAEWPAFFGSERGRIAAQKGYTLELAGMVGYLAGRLSFRPERISLYTPQQWKGSVSKAVTRAKFVRAFGEAARAVARSVPDDTIDAIMIAEHWLATNL